MVEVLCVWGLGTVSGTTVLLHPAALDLAILLAVKYFFRLRFSYPLFMLIVITSGLSKHEEAEDSGLLEFCAMLTGLAVGDVSKDRSFFQLSRFVGSIARTDIVEGQISQLRRCADAKYFT
jgi:hypothetical protein